MDWNRAQGIHYIHFLIWCRANGIFIAKERVSIHKGWLRLLAWQSSVGRWTGMQTYVRFLYPLVEKLSASPVYIGTGTVVY